MKKITLGLGILLISFVGNTQSNLNLDTWSSNIAPENWDASLNAYASVLGDTMIVQAVGYSNSGAKLKPVDLAAAGIPGVYASLSGYGASSEGGAYTALLDSVYFYQKSVDNTNTFSLIVSVAQTKWNATTMEADTVAYGEIQSLPSATFVKEGIELIPDAVNGSETPDSLKISLIYLGSDAAGVGNSYAIVDEFMLVDVATTSAGLTKLNQVALNVYPNVAMSNVNFEFEAPTSGELYLMDLNGRVVNALALKGTMNERVDVSGLEAGTYMYTVKTADSRVAQGKIVVVK